MSMIMTLTTAAIIAGVSLTEISLAALVGCSDKSETFEEGLETVFMDSHLLQKTLAEMDCHMRVVSDDEIYVKTVSGELCYRREDENVPFRLYMTDIKNREGLVENIRSFEVDYGRNIQDYTYHHIKENLGEGMSIENEYFEGEDLYITINVE